MLNIIWEFIQFYRARKYREWLRGNCYSVLGGPTDSHAAQLFVDLLASWGEYDEKAFTIYPDGWDEVNY